jgi:hypothetical protein
MGRRTRIGWTLAIAAAAVGCSAPPPPLAPVTGRVTFAGAPITCGIIVFSPDADSGCRGACATGEIGPDGRYTLATDNQPGAVPGWHRVTVASLSAGYGPRLPDRFRDPARSRLRVEVRAGQANQIDFKLEGP